MGKELLNEAMDFCRERDYRHVFLWAIDMLRAALRLHELHGFRRTEAKQNEEWAGGRITEERWDLYR